MKHNSAGQTLVESLVVLGMVVTIITGLVVAVTTSLSTVNEGKTHDQATRLAQEGIEILRSIRDANWDTFYGYGYDTEGKVKTWCLGSDGHLTESIVGLCPPVSIENMSLTRTVYMSWNEAASAMEVAVSVGYIGAGSIARIVTAESLFTNWR